MKILETASAHPGGSLARAVLDKEGNILFSPGEELTFSLLRDLRERGIRSIAVRSQPPQSPEKAGAAQPATLLRSVHEATLERFCFQDMQSPHIKVVFGLALERHGRVLLNKAEKTDKPDTARPSFSDAPAFQTERPQKVPMRSLIDSSQRMGTLPVIFYRLLERINDPDATAQGISDAVSLDPALSARLLRLVNSPFYGFPSRIDSIFRAVTLIGRTQLLTLALGATLITAFTRLPVSLVNMQAFWTHSISCGVAAKQFSSLRGVGPAESFFVSGLLHDISRLLVYSLLPQHALYMLTEAKRRRESVIDLEKETLGFGHEELGAALLSRWHCPNDLTQRVLTHHDCLTDSPKIDDVILPIANTLTQALGYGTSGETGIPALNPTAWEILGISPPHLLEQCRLLDERIRDLRTVFAA